MSENTSILHCLQSGKTKRMYFQVTSKLLLPYSRMNSKLWN